jgi:hypothetical protein
MGRGERLRRGACACLFAVVPAAASAGEADEAGPPVVAPIERGLLEFLAEEPALDDEMGRALMSGGLDREIERAAKGRKVTEDATEPQ